MAFNRPQISPRRADCRKMSPLDPPGNAAAGRIGKKGLRMDEQEQRKKAKALLLEYGQNKLHLQELEKKIRGITRDMKHLPYIDGFHYGGVPRGSGGRHSSPVERYTARKEKLEEQREALVIQSRELAKQITEFERRLDMLPDGDLLRDFYGSTTVTLGEVGEKHGLSGVACAVKILNLEKVELPRLLFGAAEPPGG